MAEIERGIKACLPAGIIAGIIIAIAVIVEAPVRIAGAFFGWLAILAGIIYGVIFGALFAIVYEKLPGNNIVKGLVYGIGLWIPFSAITLILVSKAIEGLMAALLAGLGPFAPPTQSMAIPIKKPLVLTLVAFLVWGALTGLFWGKVRK